ncbi:MAG: glycosyltransferase family 4 protein [Phycisphaerae bacterium]|nr:glycosyltransferase family 4 protein [Phycisphaerae bacterium]
MRIVHIDKFYPPTGGVGGYVEALAAAQRAAGHAVAEFGCVDADAPAGMPHRHDFTRRRLRDLPRMIHNADAAAALARFLRRNPADVAHLHNIYHHLTPAILPVLARRGVAAIMTVHDYRLACPTRHFRRPDGLCTRCWPNRFLHAASPRCAGWAGAALGIESYVQRLARRYFRWIDGFVCPTRYMAGVLRRLGAPESKLAVVGSPIRTAAPAAETDETPNRLLFAGRLSMEKGPEQMLALAERLPQADVVLLGDGPLRAELERRVRRRELPNVCVRGGVGAATVAGEMARAAAVVLPSRCMENAPLTMLEAMAVGRTVIVPDQPPLREHVRDGVTGRTFATGDDAALARVAGEVLADATARRRMGAAARRAVRDRHDAATVARRVDTLYEEAIRRCASR